MKKFLPVLVLISLLGVLAPVFVQAAACGRDNCDGANAAACECGALSAAAGDYCGTDASGNGVYVGTSKDACEAAVAAAGAGGGVVSRPPESICTTVRHDLSKYIVGCTPGTLNQSMEDAQLCCILDLMETVVDWMFVVLLIAAAIFIIFGAFLFLTSGGSPEKTKSARDKLIWALVGVAVAIAAKGLVRLIEMVLR